MEYVITTANTAAASRKPWFCCPAPKVTRIPKTNSHSVTRTSAAFSIGRRYGSCFSSTAAHTVGRSTSEPARIVQSRVVFGFHAASAANPVIDTSCTTKHQHRAGWNPWNTDARTPALSHDPAAVTNQTSPVFLSRSLGTNVHCNLALRASSPAPTRNRNAHASTAAPTAAPDSEYRTNANPPCTTGIHSSSSKKTGRASGMRPRPTRKRPPRSPAAPTSSTTTSPSSARFPTTAPRSSRRSSPPSDSRVGLSTNPTSSTPLRGQSIIDRYTMVRASLAPPLPSPEAPLTPPMLATAAPPPDAMPPTSPAVFRSPAAVCSSAGADVGSLGSRTAARQHASSAHGCAPHDVLPLSASATNPLPHACSTQTNFASQHVSSSHAARVLPHGRVAFDGLSRNAPEHACVLHSTSQHNASVQTEGTPGHVTDEADAMR
eukprot:Rhum_TRINITY_DN15399_c5_g2::Rhum_TRINITY_DN15399_c5_g2_i1::g.154493::m.154493